MVGPSTVTWVMLIGFMVSAPFWLGFCRHLVRLDRGADLIGHEQTLTGRRNPCLRHTVENDIEFGSVP